MIMIIKYMLFILNKRSLDVSYNIFCTRRNYANAKLQCLPDSLVSRLEAYPD